MAMAIAVLGCYWTPNRLSVPPISAMNMDSVPSLKNGHRQLKCFSGIELLLACLQFGRQSGCIRPAHLSLLQWYLLRTERKQLNPKTLPPFWIITAVFSVIVILLSNNVRRLPGPARISGNGSHTLSEPARKKNYSPKPASFAADSPPITKTSRSLDRAFIHSSSKLTGRPSGLVSGLIRDRLCFAA